MYDTDHRDSSMGPCCSPGSLVKCYSREVLNTIIPKWLARNMSYSRIHPVAIWTAAKVSVGCWVHPH